MTLEDIVSDLHKSNMMKQSKIDYLKDENFKQKNDIESLRRQIHELEDENARLLFGTFYREGRKTVFEDNVISMVDASEKTFNEWIEKVVYRTPDDMSMNDFVQFFYEDLFKLYKARNGKEEQETEVSF